MEHFASFILCTLLLLNAYCSEGSPTTQQQCSVSSLCNVLHNISNRQDRLEKKVKEHSAILGGRCNEGKAFSGLSTFNTASVRTLFYSQDFLSFTRSKFNTWSQQSEKNTLKNTVLMFPSWAKNNGVLSALKYDVTIKLQKNIHLNAISRSTNIIYRVHDGLACK